MPLSQGKYRLDLIGPFGLFTPAGERIEITSRKSIAMIALLVAAPSGLRTRAFLQSMLWGTREAPQAQSSLRRELSTLAKQLDGRDAGHLLLVERKRVQFLLDDVEVDVLRLGMTRPAGANASPLQFLEGIDLRDCEEFEDWLRLQRERFADLGAMAIPEAGAGTFIAQPHPATKAGHLPVEPSVSVVPFRVAGDGCNRSWLGEAISDGVGAALSRFPQLFVVAGSSAAIMAREGCGTAEIARRLGVRYLLEGAVRLDGTRARVSVHLVDGVTGQQLWADCIDGSSEAVFELDDEVARRVAPQIWSKIDLAERHYGLSQTRAAIDDRGLYWRANALFRSWSRDDALEAICLTDRLVAKFADCPLSASLAAFCNAMAYFMRWTINPQANRRAAIGHYQNALRSGGDNVEALGYAAGTLVMIGGDMGVANRLIAHALTLLPSYQPTLFWGGWVDLARKDPCRALERFELSLRINPASGVRAQALIGCGFARLMLGRTGEALAALDEAAAQLPANPLIEAGRQIAALRGEGAQAGSARPSAPARWAATNPVLANLFADPVPKHVLLG